MQKAILILAPEDPYFISIFSELINAISKTTPSVKILVSPIYGIRYGFCHSARSVYDLIRCAKHVLGQNIKQQLLCRRIKNLFEYYGADLENSNVKFLGYSSWLRCSNRNDWNSTIEWPKFKKELANYSFEDIRMGDLLIDSYLRYKPSHKFNIDDKFVESLAKHASKRMNFTKKMIRLYDICYIFSSYSTYTHHGVPLRLGQKLNVKAVTFGGRRNFFEVHKKGSFVSHSGNHTLYSEKNWISNRLQELAEESFRNRLFGKKDMTISYMSSYSNDNNAIGSISVLGERVIFLHDFYDSPHVYQWMLHQDFNHWITDTLDILVRANKRVFVKPHPNQSNSSASVVSQLKRLYKDEGLVTWLSEKTPNILIFKQKPELVISVHGSVIAESAYCGIKTLSAGDHPGLNFRLSANPSCIQEYHKLLLNPESIPFPTKQAALQFLATHEYQQKEEYRALIGKFGLVFEDIDRDKSILRQKHVKDYISTNIYRMMREIRFT